MYIWKLAPILAVEGGVDGLLKKASRSHIDELWIKLGDGRAPGANVSGNVKTSFKEVVESAKNYNIEVHGWHVPRCKDSAAAKKEADFQLSLVDELGLAGFITDAESGSSYFNGGKSEARVYASTLTAGLKARGKRFGLSSHDLPDNFKPFKPIFEELISHVDLNFPQVYYGASPSVANRLDRALKANLSYGVPIWPVGAGWIGVKEGGCESASACGERGREFIRLCNVNGLEGYSFWHWEGMPHALWDVLVEI